MARLSEVFQRDHERWEQILTETQRRVASGDWSAAMADFRTFHQGIENHMAVEEQYLFPALEGQSGSAGAATAEILRKGHRDLRVFFDELQDALAAQDEEEFCQTAAALRALLRHHDAKEETELYPAVESKLGDAGMAVIAQLANAFSTRGKSAQQ